ncbi:MAG: pyruvate kinase [Candidatus Anstonellales archaeon]
MHEIRTKIIATIGPAIEEESKLLQICHYADIIRFNFSHEPKKQIKRLSVVKKIAKNIKKYIITLADLEGPKIRTRNEEQIELSNNAEYDISVFGIKERFFYKMLEEGDLLLLDDGKLKLKMLDRHKFKPLNNYILKPNKTITIKGKDFPISGLTKKDYEDLNSLLKADFDAIAMSFVKNGSDVDKLRLIAKDKVIISKIETVAAVKNIDEIIEKSDGIMIARGDLALALDEEKVPTMQRLIINKCIDSSKPVIVATQMLDSMIMNPTPTRAEINDIYSSVLQGADALMLSGETASGAFPVESIKTMYKTISEAEKHVKYDKVSDNDIKDKIARNAVELAESYNVPIIAPTVHGTTPKKISRQRPKISVYSVTNNEKTFKYLHFFFSLRPIFFNYEPVFKKIDKIKAKLNVKNAVFVFGYPPGNHNTNTIIYI